MLIDCGLLNKLGDEHNIEPRHSWAYMHLLSECWTKCPPEKRQRLRESHPWFYNQFEAGGQLQLDLFGEDIIT